MPEADGPMAQEAFNLIIIAQIGSIFKRRGGKSHPFNLDAVMAMICYSQIDFRLISYGLQIDIDLKSI